MQILSSIASLICALSTVAQETDIRGAYSIEDVDEIVVVGVNRCGKLANRTLPSQRLRVCTAQEGRPSEGIAFAARIFFGLPEMPG